MVSGESVCVKFMHRAPWTAMWDNGSVLILRTHWLTCASTITVWKVVGTACSMKTVAKRTLDQFNNATHAERTIARVFY